MAKASYAPPMKSWGGYPGFLLGVVEHFGKAILEEALAEASALSGVKE